MRKLIVSTFLTLDGVMQAPGGPGEDDSGGFAHGGWAVNYWDEQIGQVMDETTSTPFDLVLGRKTYDIFAAYWPHAPEEAGARRFNDATKYVASRDHPTLEWDKSVLISGDVAERIAALKKEDGPELQVHGSGNLIQTLLRHNLIDQYRLLVFPLVIGSGKRLFSDGTTPSGLKLAGRDDRLRAELPDTTGDWRVNELEKAGAVTVTAETTTTNAAAPAARRRRGSLITVDQDSGRVHAGLRLAPVPPASTCDKTASSTACAAGLAGSASASRGHHAWLPRP